MKGKLLHIVKLEVDRGSIPAQWWMCIAPSTLNALTMSLVEPSISHALLANQVPLLANFFGEDRDGVTFADWHEQLELIAGLCRWSDHVKLVNLATRLKGIAYALHSLCTATQRASYQQMVDLLTSRFTPVQIQAVQSSLFHDRKQQHHVTVDEYAQDVRRLFYQAYPWAKQGTQAGFYQIKDLFIQHGDIFALNPFELGVTNIV